MPREAKTKYPLLGFLLWGPQSGYDIRKKIEGSLANFWAESYGQIYPTLQAFEREGLATRLTGSGGRIERNVYAITEAGRNELRQWLLLPAKPATFRIETLVKVFFAQLVGPQECLKHIHHFRHEHESQIAKYRATSVLLKEAFEKFDGYPYWCLTLDCGLRISRAYLDWCDHAEAVLRELDSQPTNEESHV